MIGELISLILITFLPFLELRASIPLGILGTSITIFGATFGGFQLSWPIVFLVCVSANIILGELVFIIYTNFLSYLVTHERVLRYYERRLEKTQKKIHPYVKKFGTFGIALFIAIPLPGSGVYTGALAAYLLGMDYKRFLLANLIGVIIAGILVTLITLGGVGIFHLFY
ncbi:hypothetical protein COV11_03700 [Candidatus Woesearchaeota archaeon CG10_big_fil_rev_8_21_14_0_10_30_7]|nr:MAG: hypothetical protein COV11_03700 [Candidatus Woesearchaeota archaeon CG10_big_fil_rev_8_21_14_0_10_30_7]